MPVTASPSPYRLRPARWVALAAMIGFAAVVWTWMYAGQIQELRNGDSTRLVTASTETPHSWDGSFSSCLTGPADGLPAQCHDHDYDADGDVDLADFSAIQLAYAGPVRTH